MSDSNGSKNLLYPKHITFKDGSQVSMCQKILFALFVLFFITTRIVLSETHNKFEVHSLIDSKLTEDQASFMSAEKMSHRVKRQAENGICNTPVCEKRGRYMARKMDADVDPCEDFSQYACGYYNRYAELAAGRNQVNSFTILYDQNLLVFREILEGENKDDDPEYLKNMRNYYQSCLNLAQMENIGLTPYLTSSYAREFPTLNPSWDPAIFNLNDLIERYEKVYAQPLFAFEVTSDYTDPYNKNIFLRHPELGMLKADFSKPRSDTVIMAYETYLKDYFITLGADGATAAEDARDLVDFEIQLASITPGTVEVRDIPAQQNPTTLAELPNMYTVTDVRRALLAAFNTVNVTLAADEVVINRFPSYMEQLQTLLEAASPRTVQNFFGAKYVFTYVGALTSSLREIQLGFHRVAYGTKEPAPRSDICAHAASDVFPFGMSKQFVNRTFSEESKEYLLNMITNLKAEFRQILRNSTWMTSETQAAAYEKLDKMVAKIGYPDTNFEEADLENQYKDYNMDPDQFFENKKLARKLVKGELLKKYREPVDRTEWSSTYPPHGVNAYYTSWYNEIVFLAGILQPPFFSAEFHDAVNYGAIGMIIGHEITHGFDDQGSLFDANGVLRNWWQQSDRAHFEQRKQCIINQYGSFRVDDINMTVNGLSTQGEAVADNGGMKESFRAYKRHVSPTTPQLPVLGLTNDQLFFLAYAQLWCGKSTPQHLRSLVTGGVHPPLELRIKGPLRNSQDFANAYNCPEGSPMNPRTKCEVW